MAIQLQEILARGRIFASIKKDSRPRNKIEGRIVSSNPLYEVSFKLERRHKFIRSNKNYLLVPVRKIEKRNYSGKVYNFEVEGEPHSYLTKGFAVHNCAAAIAVSSMITQMAKGKTIEDAEKISNKDIVRELGDLPEVKHHCSLLGADALHKAIKDYKKGKS
ncbi:MAG: iron-sulfur cluster assembly scaffold protein [Nanoarchaeota archaeon]|nr:iron-sulfur cluster assembly scaffold protein [Nanoarchaeota archaeon]MBU4086979.1 iron-sulfur cluster assembly scaffold protein [Nanoarchaeota archaeon]